MPRQKHGSVTTPCLLPFNCFLLHPEKREREKKRKQNKKAAWSWVTSATRSKLYIFLLLLRSTNRHELARVSNPAAADEGARNQCDNISLNWWATCQLTNLSASLLKVLLDEASQPATK